MYSEYSARSNNLFKFYLTFYNTTSENLLCRLFRIKAAKESARTRNISITWRSISESSNQSLSGLDVEAPSHPAPDLNHSLPRDLAERAHSDVDGRGNDDVDGHDNSLVNGHDNGVINGHNGDVNGHGNGGLNGHGNGNVNSQDNSDVNADDESDCNGDGDVDVTDLGDSVAKFLEIDLNGEFTLSIVMDQYIH